MTRRQREQVVELLRCAADFDGKFDYVGLVAGGFLLDYVDFINPCKPTYAIADDVVWSILFDEPVDYQHRLLEAALRVEQGEWP